MAIYRALVWKKSQLEEIGELTKEKVRLLERGKNKDFIGTAHIVLMDVSFTFLWRF